MKQFEDYVLIVRSSLTDVEASMASMDSQALGCPVITVNSPQIALDKAKAAPPHLVILSGKDSSDAWLSQMARQIRQGVQSESIVIVAITDSTDLSWPSDEDTSAIDGMFVEPLSLDILSTLNESAITKRRWLQTIYG